jgi:hypothetical protein
VRWKERKQIDALRSEIMPRGGKTWTPDEEQKLSEPPMLVFEIPLILKIALQIGDEPIEPLAGLIV